MPESRRPRGWWVPQLGWAAVLATTAGVVVLFLPGGTDPFSGPKVAVLLVGTTIGWVAHVAARATGRERTPVPRVGVAAGLYLLAMAVATVSSVSPLVSLIGRGDRHAGLVSLVAMLGLAWLVVVHTWRRPERLATLVVALAGATAVHAAYVVLARVGIDVPWPGGRPYTIPVGTMGNSNFAGAQLVVCVPLVIFLVARSTERRARGVWITVLITMVVALVLTDARGAALALFPGIAVTGWLAPQLLPRWVVRAAVVVTLLALVPLVAAARGFSYGSGSPGSKLLNNETLASRFVYWQGTVPLVRDHLVTGTGPDTFGLVFPRYAPREMTGRPVPVDKPHDILLERATDAGLLGLGSYLAVLGLTGAAVVRARRRLVGPPLALLGAWSGALVAYLVQGLTSIDAVPLAFGGWVAVAALAALADPWVLRARAALPGGDGIRAEEQRDGSGRAVEASVERPVPWGVLVVGGVVVAAAVVVALLPWAADRRLRSGLDLQGAVQQRKVAPAAMTAQLERAIAANPVDPTLRAEAAAAATAALDAPALPAEDRAALAAFAVRQSEAALEHVPDDIAARRAAATAHGVLAGSDAAARGATAQRWRELEVLDPFDPTIRLGHAALLLDWNDAVPGDDAAPARLAEARGLVDAANALTDDSSWFTWYQVAQAYERLGARDEAIEAARHSLRIERARPGPRDLITRLGAAP